MPKLVVKLPAVTRRSNRLQPQNTEKVKKETSTERSRKYREKLKNDPNYREKYEQLKTKKKTENKNYANKVKELRKANKDYDEFIKTKERLRKQKQRKKKQTEDKQKQQQNDENAKQTVNKKKPYKTRARVSSTIRKRAQRVKNVLPAESHEWAKTVTHIINNATPKRKSLLLDSRVDPATTNIQDDLNDLVHVVGVGQVGRPQSQMREVKRRLAFGKNPAMRVWNSKKHLSQFRRRQEKKTLSKPQKFHAVWKGKVTEFLDKNSRMMPNKKDTILIDGQPVPKRHLLESKHRLFKKFKAENPEFKKSFTTFNRMIPKCFKVLNLSCRRVCVCSKDYNMDQQIEALNKLVVLKGLPNLKTTSRMLSEKTVCVFDAHMRPERACVERDCRCCGPELVKTFYEPLLNTCTDSDKVRYHQWENKPESYVNREGKVVKTKRWVQTEKMCSAETLVNIVIDSMKSFPAHIFRADFQHHMESSLMKNLPLSHCVVVMDFSQNIALEAQDEIESAHWTTKQVTLHPIHIVRHGPNSTEETPNIIQESLIILSDSLSHNADAVYTFTRQLLKHLKENEGPCEIEVVHRFTDNCATQYKSKEAFAHLNTIEDEHRIKLVYHYTESGHGKGPSDGHGAAIKKRIERLILGGEVINNAYQAYLALVKTQSLQNQKIIYLPQRKMVKEAPSKASGLKTVKGTQSYHMIRTLPGSQGTVVCRDLSCTCDVCITGKQGSCFNAKYYSPDKIHCVIKHSSADYTGDLEVERIPNMHGDGSSASTQDDEAIYDQSIIDNDNHQSQLLNALDTFSDQVALKGWCLRDGIPADGNCFFYAIADQMRRLDQPQQIDPLNLRLQVVEHIDHLPKERKEEITNFLTQSLTTYVHEMRKDGTYADHVCIQAASDFLNAGILVVHGNENDVRLSPSTSSGHHNTLVIGYIPEIQHYVSLGPLKRFDAYDFVAVRLVQGRRKKEQLYIAKVLEVDDEVKLRFLVETSTEGVYTWPRTDDISWQPHTDVLKKLKAPELLLGRGIKLKFCLNEITESKNLLN